MSSVDVGTVLTGALLDAEGRLILPATTPTVLAEPAPPVDLAPPVVAPTDKTASWALPAALLPLCWLGLLLAQAPHGLARACAGWGRWLAYGAGPLSARLIVSAVVGLAALSAAYVLACTSLPWAILAGLAVVALLGILGQPTRQTRS